MMLSETPQGPTARLTPSEALEMLSHGDTAELMLRADRARRKRHGLSTYYVHSLNLNPTNICENRCELCAFWREPGAADAYATDLSQARDLFQTVREWGLTDLHIVGGLNPELDLAYYASLIRLAKEILPNALVQGMTAVEIHDLARRENISTGDVLRRLRDAGLGAIPGGGAEIFEKRVRERICSKKISAEEWLAIHGEAHRLGLPTNATMLYGHVETLEDLVDHMTRLRDQQDRTGGFQAFIPLPFHVEGTKIAGARGPSGYLTARVVAVSRLFLDNFPHVRILANYTERKLLEVLTQCGADDVGGTSLDERIARAAGASDSHRFTSTGEIEAFIESVGLEPVLVDSAYEPPRPTNRREERERDATSPLLCRERPVAEALARAESGQRLSAEQAIALHDGAPFLELGRIAHARRLQQVPGNVVTYVLDRNISITNVCEAGCKFCAFHVDPGSENGFVLSIDGIVEKVLEAKAAGATQIMLQGGLNPALDLGFYETMFSTVKQSADVWLHSLSPAEIVFLARGAGLSLRQTLERLRAAGLDSLPGGGAEILVDAVRRAVSPRKIRAGEWFEVMEAAHALGMQTTATMVYGLGETTAQRVEHLLGVRDLQDRTGGFTAFIPWSFQPNRTQISLRPQTGIDYLRLVALARLVLDNVAHLQAGWVTEGPDVAQLALQFGADDFGGVLMEERVVRATGVSYAVTAEQVAALIRDAGMVPAQRTTQYERVATDGARPNRSCPVTPDPWHRRESP